MTDKPPKPPSPTKGWWDKHGMFSLDGDPPPTIGAGVTPIGPPPPCACDCRERLEKLRNELKRYHKHLNKSTANGKQDAAIIIGCFLRASEAKP